MATSALKQAESEGSTRRSCPVPEDIRSSRHLAVLQYLRDETTATVGDLVNVVRNERGASMFGADQYRVELAMSLHEEVLPSLVEAGLVEYEPTNAEVTVAFLSAAVANWLDDTAPDPLSQ